jgi:protein SCO1/2
LTSYVRAGRAILAGLTVALAAAVAWALADGATSGPTPRAGGRAPVQRGLTVKVDFALRDVTGHPYHFRRETDGRVTLLFFGYAACPDVCPVTLATLAAVLGDLPVDERRRVTVVFVSTDPERDTPARVAAWLTRFDPDFVGLVGSRSEVATAQAALGLVPATTGADPLVIGHAAQVIVFARDGQTREDYPFGTRQAEWSVVLRRLLAVPGPPDPIGPSVRAADAGGPLGESRPSGSAPAPIGTGRTGRGSGGA